MLSRALRLIEDRANAHEPLDLESAQALVQSQPLVELDYFEVVDPRTLEPLAENCRDTPFRGEGAGDHRRQGRPGPPDRQRAAGLLTGTEPGSPATGSGG